MTEETIKAPKRSFFKTPLFIVSLGILLIAAIILGFFWWREAKRWVWTNDAYIEGYNVQVSADIEARIIHQYVDEGSIVKKGDLLVELQRDILESERLQAQTEIALLEESVKEKAIFMEKMRDNYIVAKKEFEKDIISFLNYDHKEKDFLMSEAALMVAEKNLENGIAKLGVIDSHITHTYIYAPRDGMIAKRWTLPGDVATIGLPLFELNELDNVWITANLEETKLRGVRDGAPVKIHVDCYPGREFKGHVWVIKASAASKFSLIPPENATGNFTKVVQRIPVKIKIDRSKEEESLYLFPGMSCEIKIRVD